MMGSSVCGLLKCHHTLVRPYCSYDARGQSTYIPVRFYPILYWQYGILLCINNTYKLTFSVYLNEYCFFEHKKKRLSGRQNIGGSNKNRFWGFSNRNLFLIYFLAFLAAGFFAAFLAGFLAAFLAGAFLAAGLAAFLAGAFLAAGFLAAGLASAFLNFHL